VACLRRLVDFAEPTPDDVCLDVARGDDRPVATAIRSRVRDLTAVDLERALSLPYADNAFTLVTARYPVHQRADPGAALREMLRVCRPGGRLILADRIKTNSMAAERAPLQVSLPSLTRLTGSLADAGAEVRRLDVFVVERPAEPWLAGCDDARAAEIRRALVAEIDGGPATGARPRVIGGELWFTQSCAHIAAVPRVRRGGSVPLRHAGVVSAHPGADGDPAAPAGRA
jgi:SAM-dependent methyltransferase